MGLLPCIKRGGDRWWLPLSEESTQALGLLLISRGRSRHVGDGFNRNRLLNALSTDPPVLIFAALGWPGEEVTLDDLCDWLIEHALGCFASGDAFIGAPKVAAAHTQKWQRLRDYFRTLPTEDWLDNAHLWLEVLGPRVSEAWKKQWPTIVVESQNDVRTDSEFAGGAMLQQLARMMQRQSSLEGSFNHRLDKAKLGALKQLAYGLSHEINNPLANISTRAQQLQRSEDDPTRHAILQRIVEQVYRAHDMIADLMFFANPPAPVLDDCDLGQTVLRVIEDFREELERQAIRLEVKTPDQTAKGRADDRMVGEAIRAILRNAIDAIGCEGTIVVSLVPDQSRWMIHVADSGPGLSDFAREHAFEPYFSGREAGRGLGLGLCRAYRIAKLHGGEVTLAGGPTGCVATIILGG